ncbi:hypothetical protein Kpol_1064p13 [Vanderwaltozyma polyspora DSM 70294]|uniref:DASH complex subunit ASK1 n=1 Tax=Vanderwaltozyma polyspora (strain ATCC 22028 / DSM 70294 / BCRC 21397 / CBS 2163 / NBRC 10782 / NRRL Y-8283 / UCD 57-17) TaxID=436907 RepID=A7TMD8_VANPO|nr:uncharacterized protein Kpol_1064p13 [Vanderwaltozyma polyspora DSM 70294]EDO16532.1 hypothetical protein Kpol_1064p13 [Vanderwaltozyma polyspora DSM 70294]
MSSDNADDTIEKLEQEITLYLQKIDSNLSYCFTKITQDIVPYVQEYGEVCDNIMDSSSWLLNMFQQSGNVDLNTFSNDRNNDSGNPGKLKKPTETLFPSNNNTGNINSNSSEVIMVPSMPKPAINSMSDGNNGMATNNNFTTQTSNNNNNNNIDNNNTGFTQDFHTADITSTGRVLKVPDSSDEDNRENDDGDESTIQRQRRKRKVSLLLQQEYASSSSVASPFLSSKNRREGYKSGMDTNGRDNDENNELINSSPMRTSSANDKVSDDPDESTKEVPKPGTVIHFTTS